MFKECANNQMTCLEMLVDCFWVLCCNGTLSHCLNLILLVSLELRHLRNRLNLLRSWTLNLFNRLVRVSADPLQWLGPTHHSTATLCIRHIIFFINFLNIIAEFRATGVRGSNTALDRRVSNASRKQIRFRFLVFLFLFLVGYFTFYCRVSKLRPDTEGKFDSNEREGIMSCFGGNWQFCITGVWH